MSQGLRDLLKDVSCRIALESRKSVVGIAISAIDCAIAKKHWIDVYE